MRTGDEITIEPSELVAGGDALARVDGFPIFAGNVYPGDVALVRLTEVKKGFARAELVRIERASPLRRAAPCPVAEECGGCDWTALRLDAQLAAKKRILAESLRRIGKFDAWPPIALHVSPLNYRLRSRLHADGDAVGFYAMSSRAQGAGGGAQMVHSREHHLRPAPRALPPLRVVPLARECEVVGVETAKHPIAGETWEIDGRFVVGEFSLLGYTLSTGAFFQVNRHLLETMLRRVSEIAASGAPHPRFADPLPAGGERVAEGRVRGATRGDRTAIDLYAGVGFFTRPLTTLFERVIAVEGSNVSIRYLRINTTAEAIHAPVEQWVARMPEADFIFLDPPRAGARPEVIDAVAKKAGRICYLSCDPVTFARDANRLRAAGWRLATLDLLDLFPNTHHVETLSSFERAA
jgi:23S rRNA (uracil1939-C5)-methyltransferase